MHKDSATDMQYCENLNHFKLRTSENKLQRKACGPRRDEVTTY
jgi:hypothetical protein